MHVLRILAAACLFSSLAVADSIRIGDKIHDGVYVAAKGDLFEVRFPDTGKSMTLNNRRADVKLIATSPKEERERIHAEWQRRSAALAGEAPSPKPQPLTAKPKAEAPPAPKRLTSNDLRQAKALEELAEFETQLILWAQIPDEYREAMFANVALAAESTAELNTARIGALHEQRAANNDVIADEAEALAKKQKQANRALESKSFELSQATGSANSKLRYQDIFDSSDYYANMRDSRLDSAVRNELFGQSSGGQRQSAQFWDNKYVAESNYRDGKRAEIAEEYLQKEKAIKAEAKSIQRQSEAETRAANARMAEIEAANSTARSDQTVLQQNAISAIARAERELDRMTALEEALASGRPLSVPFNQVAELKVVSGEDEASVPVTVKGDSWRILWGVSGYAQGSKIFSISVIDNETGKPLRGSSDDVSSYRRYLLLEGPGEFTIRASGVGDGEAIVVADEVPFSN